MDGFVHLHVHSHYSLLDGAIRIPDLLSQTTASGVHAVALTDHGNLFGAIEFYRAAKDAGVKPILGIEAYISPTTRHDRSMRNINTASYHLLLLATDKTGWGNLIKLSSRAYMEGFYYRPRIDRELLAQHNEGLICTTACLGGEVPSALLAGQKQRARKIAGEYRDIFGPQRFFIEIQNHQLPEQQQINPQLVGLAEELGVGLVGTNDVHFLRPEDKPAHEVLTCISTGKTLTEGGAIPYSPQLYLKDPAEMRQALAAWDGACDNTLKIAEMCDLQLDFSAKHLPVFKTPDGTSPTQHLRKLTSQGLQERFGEAITDEHRKRLARELDVIEQKGYGSYVLIVHDFVQYARQHDIPCGARGSGCATLMGYCLGISDVDPMRYGLLFERWTDPQREEDPDFDIDVCQEGRSHVIQYIRAKYGHVAQVITYGTLKARAAIRDVGRVMNISLGEVDTIAKKIPDALGTTIDSALETEPDLRRLSLSDPRIGELMGYARTLEGLARHAGVHAAAILVADEPLENFIPLYKQADGDEAITQWDGPTCEKVGLMKTDLLGLKTLTVIQRACKLVAAHSGKDIDPQRIPLDDQEVFELFRQGHTDGVFQFESGGMKSVLLQMHPTRIEDLIAANAMYRPGPMELIASYCARKNGAEPVPSLHPLVDDILAETYGIMCYQEQVMQVLHRLGKLPLNTALTLIKAISKKNHDIIASERSNFIAGAGDNGICADEAERLFDLIQKFAGYGFNKAHSTRYAIIAYQTAYFKTHWPMEFLAATLTLESSDTDKVVQYIAEADRMGIKVVPPDINTCDSGFTVDGDQVRFGLGAVKGVGVRAVEAIVAAREQVARFSDLYHFCRNVELRAVNRTAIEALIRCGAFDSLGAHRAAMIAALDSAIQIGQGAAEARRNGQMDLFGTDQDETAPPPRFPNVEPFSEAQLLAAEKQALGFYITSHPLTHYAREVDGLSRPPGISIARLGDFRTDLNLTIGCMIASVRPTVTKTGRSAGKKMAMLTVEDLTGKCDAVVFSDAYERVASLLKEGAIVFLEGRLDRRREIPSIIISDVIPIDKAIEKLTGSILIRLPATTTELQSPPQTDGAETLQTIRGLLGEGGGPCEIQFELRPVNRRDVCVRVRTDRKWFPAPSRKLVAELTEFIGEQNLLLQPKSPAPNGDRQAYTAYTRNGAAYHNMA